MDGGKIREYGTPFSLKEKYSRDRLRLLAKPEAGAKLEARLEELKCRREKKSERLYDIRLQNSMLAVPILKETEKLLEGFELVQGSMDDVFLNITGKNLEESVKGMKIF